MSEGCTLGVRLFEDLYTEDFRALGMNDTPTRHEAHAPGNAVRQL